MLISVINGVIKCMMKDGSMRIMLMQIHVDGKDRFNKELE